MKVSSQDMCTHRATDFAPTPSTLLLYGVLCILTFQSNTLTIVDHRNYYYNQTYQRIESYLKPIHPSDTTYLPQKLSRVKET